MKSLMHCLLGLSLVLAVGCGPKEIHGTSTSTMTLPAGTKITLNGPMNWNGIEIPAGASITIEAPPGGLTITTTDEFKGQARMAQNSGGDYEGTGSIDPGSTYAFRIPSMLGSYKSDPMPIVGAFSFLANASAAVPQPNGSTVLNPAGLLSAECNFAGPAPIWQLPMHGTPIGDLDLSEGGVGYVRGEPFNATFSGDTSAVSGVLDQDGISFTLDVPLILNVGGSIGTGVEHETGTIE